MLANKPYYEIVCEVLAANINSGRLPPGLRLFTSAVADRLGVSRPPVRRALRLLEQQQLIHTSADRGYIVGSRRDTRPSRLNLHQLDLDLPERLAGHLVQPGWERIFEEVERDILSCIPFGTYQISEAALGEYFSVGRTVVRDVLARMHVRGLIAKDRSSHWIAGPLSARRLDEAHEIRRLLEPHALSGAMTQLSRAELVAMRERVREALEQGQGLSQDDIDLLERDLHQNCMTHVRNRTMSETVQQTQLSLVINRLFGTYIGLHDETPMLLEHRLVLDHVMLGDVEGAQVALRFHLDADHERARDRLKVLSIFGDPDIAPYLSRVH